MNILPLVVALVLMLTVLLIEKIEQVKNQTIIQKEYQEFLKEGERLVFNERQERLFEKYQQDIKQLSFRYFVDKQLREKEPNITKQYKMLNIELMKILYSEAAFYKNLELKRPNFLEEMVNAIEKSSDEASEKLIKSIEDIARLKLEDPELQEAFYKMLKGTISRENLKNLKEKELFSSKVKEKSYLSLFNFINFNGTSGQPAIEIQAAPREILKAIFLDDHVVEEIIAKRKELANSDDNGASAAFQNAFLAKRRDGLDDKLLNFKITAKKKTDNYN